MITLTQSACQALRAGYLAAQQIAHIRAESADAESERYAQLMGAVQTLIQPALQEAHAAGRALRITLDSGEYIDTDDAAEVIGSLLGAALWLGMRIHLDRHGIELPVDLTVPLDPAA